MTYYGSEEHEPVTWWRGHAVYAAHIAMVIFVGSMIVSGLLRATGHDSPLLWGAFNSSAVLQGQVWRLVTYSLVNVPSQNNIIWFAINMALLVWFGREVEKTFGRRKFLLLFGCLIVVPSLFLTAVGPWLPTQLFGEHCTFGIFIAFATLFPSAAIFFTLAAHWIALALIAFYTVAMIADNDWAALAAMWTTSIFAFGFVRHQQGRFSLPTVRLPRRKPKLHILPDAPEKPKRAAVAVPVAPSTASMAEVDALLDKIAQHGIGSLTPKERAKLDAARRELKRKQ
jgi:membrane associated rhomboid family serine protease